MNATLVLTNYPLTLLALWAVGDQATYAAVIILLIFNKMCLSALGSKVRQHFSNPTFAKTHNKMTDPLYES
jgi:hypothetical protein